MITVYASAAFVLIELVNNLAEPLHLPVSLPVILLVILAAGFPLAIILSWIYDLASGSFVRTKPLEAMGEAEEVKVPSAWKVATYVSFIVILGLVVFNVVTRSDVVKPGSVQSMVVLPFLNYTGDDQLDYVTAGMHASLIGDMGKVGGLRILSGTTSNAYKDTDKSVPEIASELGVDAVVEPTVTCYGDSICLQVKVFSAFPDEKLLWVNDYREDRTKILGLYNRITKQIANEVRVKLTDEEETLLAGARTVNKEAYDHYLMGKYFWERLGEGDLEKSHAYFNRAIELDPGWAPPYAGVAEVYGGLMQLGYMPPGEAMIEINKNLNRAIELDPDFPGSHYSKAIFGVWMEWDWEKGEREFLRALEINPNDALSRIYYSHLLLSLMRYEEAFIQSEMAVELDPMNPLVLALSAMVDEHGHIQRSLEKSKKALEIDPEHHFAQLAYVEATCFNGEFEESLEAELKTIQVVDEEVKKEVMTVFRDRGYEEAIRTLLIHLEEYAKTNYFGYFERGEYYWKVGELENSIQCFMKAYEMHDPMMPYITLSEIGFDDIKHDPRIIAIIEEMNLPLSPPV